MPTFEKKLHTSSRKMNCGTHSIGQFIYLNWDELQDSTKDKVIDVLGNYYTLPEGSVNKDNFKAMFGDLCYNDIQIIMGLALNRHIEADKGDGYSYHYNEVVAQLEGDPTSMILSQNDFQKGSASQYWSAGCISWLLTDLGINHDILSNSASNPKLITQRELSSPVASIHNPGAHYELGVDSGFELESSREQKDGSFFESNVDDERVKSTVNVMFRQGGADNFLKTNPNIRKFLPLIGVTVTKLEVKRDELALNYYGQGHEEPVNTPEFHELEGILELMKVQQQQLYQNIAGDDLVAAEETCTNFRTLIEEHKNKWSSGKSVPSSTKSHFFDPQTRGGADQTISDLFEQLLNLIGGLLKTISKVVNNAYEGASNLFSSPVN